jgi:hypothetical protein
MLYLLSYPSIYNETQKSVPCLPIARTKHLARACTRESAPNDVEIRIFAMRQDHSFQPLCPPLKPSSSNIHEHRSGCPSHATIAKPRHSFATSSLTRDSGHALISPSSDTRPCHPSNTPHRVEYTNTLSTDRHSSSRKSRASFVDYVGARASS